MAEAPRSDETLTPDDAVNVLEEILEAETQSYILGLLLKLPVHTVESIHDRYLQPRDRLLHVLIEFTKQEDPRPSWNVIVDALRNRLVNLHFLAKKVEAAHILPPTSAPAKITADSPQDVTTSSAVAINTTIGGPRAITTSSTAVTNTTADDKIPILSTSEWMSIQHIQEEIRQLDKRFHEIKNATRETLEKCGIVVKRVADTLTSLSPDSEEIHAIFIDSKFSDLYKANDHFELFGRVNCHWNYLNYPLLDHLIQSFDLKEVKGEMEAYKADLQSFREKTPLAMFCQSQNKKCTNIPSDFQEVVAKFQWPENGEPVMLEEVEKFRRAYADHYHLRDFAMMLDKINCGSFIVTWLIPECIVVKLKANAPESILKKFFVVRLEIAGECIYPTHATYMFKLHTDFPPPPSASPLSSSGYSSPVSLSSLSLDESGGEREQGDGRGLGRGQRRGTCLGFKFLGECKRHSRGECLFQHDVMLQNTCKDYVPIPEGMPVALVIGSRGRNLKKLRSVAECYVRVENKRVLIIAENQENLKRLVERMKLLMSQENVSGLSRYFIHPRGISIHGTYKFKPYSGIKVMPRAQTAGIITLYELCGVTQQSEKVHEGTPDEAERLLRTRKQFRPKESIKQSLAEILKKLCEKKRSQKFITRLEARFGKIAWGRLPESAHSKEYSFETLADLMFAEDSKHVHSFQTDVKATSASYVRSSDQSVIETFTVKMTTRDENETKLDVCLSVKKGDDERTDLQVLMVSKNNIKDAKFSILNLHRLHDMRIGLDHFEHVQEADPLQDVVRELMGKISFPSRHMVRIQPKTAHWNVHIIRHKKKFTSMIDDSFAFNVAEISEHNFDNRNEEEFVEFDMMTRNVHMEVELQNLAWARAFSRDGGLSSIALYTGSEAASTSDFDTIPYPWQPEHILRDFDTFWSHLDTLSDRLDGLNLK